MNIQTNLSQILCFTICKIFYVYKRCLYVKYTEVFQFDRSKFTTGLFNVYGSLIFMRFFSLNRFELFSSMNYDRKWILLRIENYLKLLMPGTFKCAIKLTSSCVSCLIVFYPVLQTANFHSLKCENGYSPISFQRKIFFCWDTSSDRLHRTFLYGISFLRANITLVYGQKDEKQAVELE